MSTYPGWWVDTLRADLDRVNAENARLQSLVEAQSKEIERLKAEATSELWQSDNFVRPTVDSEAERSFRMGDQ